MFDSLFQLFFKKLSFKIVLCNSLVIFSSKFSQLLKNIFKTSILKSKKEKQLKNVFLSVTNEQQYVSKRFLFLFHVFFDYFVWLLLIIVSCVFMGRGVKTTPRG